MAGWTHSLKIKDLVTWDGTIRAKVFQGDVETNRLNWLPGTAGSIIFSDGTNLTQDNANLFWDDTNNRLGIGTTNPTHTLDVVGNVVFSNLVYAIGTIRTNSIKDYAGGNVIIQGDAGKVGIGTITPRVGLDVSGAIISNSSVSGATLYAGTENVGTHIASGAIHFASGAIWTDVDANTASCAIIGTNTANIATNVTNINLRASSAALTTHTGDSSDPHGATLTQTYAIISSGAITSDNDASGAEVIRNILIGTEETPPTASGVIQGTVYLQYTA